ncbi:phosphodiesterase [Roseibium alexandrii]|uniref:3',5'-cyclic adenosine monophosphate phosphodiesterase CpdA n=1 Tax=Roseibium alexandrii TaxID=388408 RepID=A0A0M7A3M1_9HYPH|nr:phosphodiesterase [Roseibium alexandrii]CTQ69675.1 3',5'-cyclic adenosine monophosphate phosphodiesterase CpdA [Roseibium alexandrii]
MTKIIQISDTHIVPEGTLAYGQVDTAKALAETVATINRLLPQIGPVDLVIVTGDLTERGSEEEYGRFKALMADLDLPYRVLPGNHDRREPMRRSFADAHWMPRTGPLDWQIDLEDFAVIGLDSLTANAAHGTLEPATLSFLTDALAHLSGKPVLAGFHHPPFAVGIEAMDAQNLRNASSLGTALSRHTGQVLMVCGHLHRSIAGLFSGRLCQVCPGTSHAVTLDQRSNAGNSLTKEPGGLLLHEWRDGGFLSHLVPIGTYPGGYPFK